MIVLHHQCALFYLTFLPNFAALFSWAMGPQINPLVSILGDLILVDVKTITKLFQLIKYFFKSLLESLVRVIYLM